MAFVDVEVDRIRLRFLDACRDNNVAEAIYLLENEGADPNCRYADELGFSPLHMACENGNFRFVRYLLGKGADPTIRSAYGSTPLHHAVLCGHVDIVRYLLDVYKVDINAQDEEGDTPVIRSYSNGNDHECMFLLLDRGADPSIRGYEDFNLLHSVAINNDSRTMKVLLEHPSMREDVLDVLDGDGKTALNIACSYGNDEEDLLCASYLLEKGANPNIPDDLGRTPLHHACMQANTGGFVSLLLNHDANPFLKDVSGNTPMHQACMSNRPECIRVMLDHNVNLRLLLDDENKRPLDIAMEEAHQDCVRALAPYTDLSVIE